ncbi:MAG TPA: hypothetical protein VF407_02685 [Polyangiaceae bacterium]
MRSVTVGLGIIAVIAAVGCHERSTQQSQTQTTGAPVNANSSGDGWGDHSGSANPQGQQSAQQGNAPRGAQMMDNADQSGAPVHDRPATSFDRYNSNGVPTAPERADAGH